MNGATHNWCNGGADATVRQWITKRENFRWIEGRQKREMRVLLPIVKSFVGLEYFTREKVHSRREKIYEFKLVWILIIRSTIIE